MNDLYLKARPLMRPLDVVAFAGPASNPLSCAIEALAGKYSHVAVVREPWLHATDTDVTIFESTIEAGPSGKTINGAQTNPLGKRLGEYPAGSRADLYRLTAEARARVNYYNGLEAFYALCGSQEDRVRYDIGALFRFLLPDIVVARWEPHTLTAQVCSVCVSACLEAARATIGVTAWRMTPLDDVSLPIFEAPMRIL